MTRDGLLEARLQPRRDPSSILPDGGSFILHHFWPLYRSAAPNIALVSSTLLPRASSTYNQCTAEWANLHSVSSSIEPLSSRKYVFDCLAPFELEVLPARLKYWAGDFWGYLDPMYAIIKRCKIMAKVAVEGGEREREKQTERERGWECTHKDWREERWRSEGR